MPHDEGLPQTGTSQEIGDDAVSCLFSNKPKNWKLSQISSNDFGFDYQVQLTHGDNVVHPFRLQLKGTRSPKRNAQNTHYEISISVSTLRYFDNTDEPVLLVLCDLSLEPEEPRDCPIYYVWARAEIERLDVKNITQSQQRAIVHVPASNRLERNTDLLPEVRRLHRLSRAGHLLNSTVARIDASLSPDLRLDMVESIVSKVGARNAALLHALAEPNDDIWIDPPRDTLPWLLTKARSSLDEGLIARCENLLCRAENKLQTATELELAEYWFQLGRLRRCEDQEAAAAEAFNKANEVYAQPRYLAAWAESELRSRWKVGGTDDYIDVLQALSGSHPMILGIKARIYAAAQNYDAAIAVLDGFSGDESLASRAVIQTMYGKPEEALRACVEGLASNPELSAAKRHLFIILRARAMFSIALRHARVFENADSNEDYVILPPSGPLGTSGEALKAAWNCIEEAVEVLEEIRWSANTEFVVDMWAATASMLGRQNLILPRLLAAAQNHPMNPHLQMAADSVAAQCGEFEKALEANKRSPRSETQILRRIALLHELERHRLCTELLEQEYQNIEPSHPMLPSVMVHAILSADMIARTDLVQRWLDSLRSQGPAAAPVLAEAEYLLAVHRNPAENRVALTHLQKIYAELGHPEALTRLLFRELNPENDEDAEEFLRVAERLRESVRLSPIVAIRVCFALAATRQWQALLDLCEEAGENFDVTDRINALRAFALDQLGRADEARRILEALIEAGADDGLALQAYVNIAIRLGSQTKARTAVELILQNTKSRERKLDCLKLLFSLEQRVNPDSNRLVDLAVRFGEISDRDSQSEEGTFLTMLIAATSLNPTPPTPQQISAFQARSIAFFEKFPDSGFLRRVQINTDSGPEELLRSLKLAVGLTPAAEEQRKVLQSKLKSGEQALPFSWRPRLAISDASDVAHLWELAKRSSYEDRHLHLIMTLQGRPRSSVVNFASEIPILDLHTLMVVRDLDLIPLVFKLFAQIAIAQSTLIELANMAQSFAGSPLSASCALLQDALVPFQSQILQPPDSAIEIDSNFPESSRVIKALIQEGRYLFYSDDVIHRLWILESEESVRGFCTLDLLFAAEERGWITPLYVADKISDLCSWRVGLEFPLQYHLLQLKYATRNSESQMEAIESLKDHKGFAAISEGLWGEHMNLTVVSLNTGNALRNLLQDTSYSLQSIVAYLDAWFQKVVAHLSTASLGPDILASLFIACVAPARISANASYRMWIAYFCFTQRVHGAWNEDVKEKSISLLATLAARLDKEVSRVPVQNRPKGIDESTIGERLVLGLNLQSQEYFVFASAYTSAIK